jgi:hypothetical protein
MPEASVYDVNRHLEVILWAMVGEGQLASVVVNRVPATEVEGHFRCDLGLGEALKNTELEIEATLVRANPHTDRASLTFVMYQVRRDRLGPERRLGERSFPIPFPLQITFSQGEQRRLVTHTISLL